MFNGNNVFLQDGKSVIPSGAIADRLMAGDFGPRPNHTAPPGFRIPDIVQALQGTQAPAEQPQQQATPDWMEAMSRIQMNQAAGTTGTAGYFGSLYGKHAGPDGGGADTPFAADLAALYAVNPEAARAMQAKAPGAQKTFYEHGGI